jgi:endonuclease/exonuclease/phosphatase family metal-dependent hydrolase
MRLLNIFPLLFVSLIFAGASFAQSATGTHYAVAFYNCENLFDYFDNPLTADEEFTPGGKYHYTQKIYRQKLANIAAVIQKMDNGSGPAVIGLAEVENTTVLRDLTEQPAIRSRKYRYVLHDGPDPRGINVGLLYDPARFRVLNSAPLPVNISTTGGKAVTRHVLHVTGILAGDTLHILVNHWPSRRGGEEKSEEKRAIAARVNKSTTDALLRKNKNARIIIMGDLNDNPTDNSISVILGAKADRGNVSTTGLFNPFASMHTSTTGTEVYRHRWNLFDQIICSGTLLTGKGLHFQEAEIFKPGFIIDTYKGHEGEPHRSFKGTYWINGYSDHFPVVVYLSGSRR